MTRDPFLPLGAAQTLRLLALASAVALAACSSAPQRGEIAANGNAGGSGGIRTKLDGWGPKTPPPGFPQFVDHSVGQEEISMQAMGLVGVPYRWGGNTPAAGFDCSGLVRYVVERAASVDLPRTTADMSREGVSISPDEIAPGDLIFFNTSGRAHSHVGVYVGDYRFVNAPSTGGTVRIDYVTNPYWAKRFDGIRRIAGRGPMIQDSPVAPPQAPRSIMPPTAVASSGAPPVLPTIPAVVAVQPQQAAQIAAPPPQQVQAPVSAYAYVPAPLPAPVARVERPAQAPTSDPIAAAIVQADNRATRYAPASNQVNSTNPVPREMQRATPERVAVSSPGESRTAALTRIPDDDPIARIVNRGY